MSFERVAVWCGAVFFVFGRLGMLFGHSDANFAGIQAVGAFLVAVAAYERAGK